MDWTAADAARLIAVPGAPADKYSRGVLGVATGSQQYPGAAVLGVEGAVRAGVGMVRYLGPSAPTQLVLQRRPEVVPGSGRVQAWLLGSGLPAAPERLHEDTVRLQAALAAGVPAVVDAGALDLVSAATAPVVVTPHYRELERLLAGTDGALDADRIAADPAAAAARAADRLGVTVLLKGARTEIAAPGGPRLGVALGTPWLATAGSGDVLGGVLGALLATHAAGVAARGHAALAELAASAAALHGLAGVRASHGGRAPIAALDIAEALPATIAELLG